MGRQHGEQGQHGDQDPDAIVPIDQVPGQVPGHFGESR